MALRFNEDYLAEIKFAEKLNFEFFQIWFFNGTLSVNSLQEPKENKIKEYGFPIILHAVFDINDFEKYGKKLLELLDYSGQKEVIIHPVCTSEEITSKTVFKLSEQIARIYQELKKRQIKLYVENNSIIDGFFNSVDELSVIFDNNSEIELLLDLAHINGYSHLRDIIKMRKPKCIHIADKRFGVPHEHIALGDGDLNFAMIFKEMIPDFNGRIILEAVESNNDIEKSKQIIDNLFKDYQK